MEDYGSMSQKRMATKIERKEKVVEETNLDDTSGVAESMATDVVCKDQMLPIIISFFHCHLPLSLNKYFIQFLKGCCISMYYK
jgi:hypothetical protein